MKKQQELERQMEKQRQIEKQKEEQRQKMMEQREVGTIVFLNFLIYRSGQTMQNQIRLSDQGLHYLYGCQANRWKNKDR